MTAEIYPLPLLVTSTPAVANLPPEADLARLTDRLQAGDEAAWREFHERYFQRLFRYLLVATRGQEELAREALQQTMIRAARYMKRFDSEAGLWAWLTVLGRSALTDEQRKRGRYLGFLERWFREPRPAPETGRASLAEESLRAAMAAELAALPDEERNLLEQMYLADSSTRELAAALAITERAVASRLLRARQKLKAAVLKRLKHEK
ncbi:MAG TPA: sigma-70 family RNA polymerase sigma factor [Verrucomicrobiae bacterium]|nr:sigma-70 family RNA polymerase sigma factor [Verrucomicrobiae bacterium]